MALLSYPRSYPTGEGDNHPDYRDWNAMVDVINGFTPSGTFKTLPTYIISKDATPDYYASNAYQTIYGGPGDAGGVDGGNPQAVVQAALDNLTSGGSLWFKAGTYDFDDTCCNVENSNVAIFGEGKATHIIGDDSGNGAFYFYNASGTRSNFLVRNIYFTGDPTGAESHCLNFLDATNILVEGCWFEDIGDEPVNLGKSCRNAVIRNNWFLNTGNAGALQGTAIMMQSGHHLIEGNTIIGSTATPGISLSGIVGTEIIEDVIIRNNRIYGESNLNVGIYFNAVSYDIHDVLVQGNQIYDCTLGGIIDGDSGTEDVYNIIVANNTVIGGGSDGNARGAIQFIKNSPRNITAVGNLIEDWDATTALRGIRIYADNMVVANNRIKDIGADGIQVLYDTENGSVTGNLISGCANTNAAAIRVQGPYCSITGNTIVDCYRGFYVTDSAEHIAIGDNILDGTLTVGLTNSAAATDLDVEHNIGYRTENFGAATILNGNTDIVVNHGLTTTPTTVVVTGRNSDTVDLYTVTFTATQFTIRATGAVGGDRTVSWYAKYQP